MLEAFHYCFHPTWSLFRSLVNPADVVHVDTFSMIPSGFLTKAHIHFNYSLAGGTMMGMGTYNFAPDIDAEPEECLSCDVKAFTEGSHHDCDYKFKIKSRFPNAGIGEAISTLQGLTIWHPFYATVTHKQVVVPDKTLCLSGKADDL